MSDQHTQEGQIQRAKRLREQIEGLKAGRPVEAPGHQKSLREQIEERAGEDRAKPVRQLDASNEP
ncbi:MAG TPA: hypothetical protein VK686_17385 [Bryobacteraceae bacterium]|jgi:hypothetical protein|nr:hypothetical protein [Bryobacteraceae bacterium]